MKAEWSEGSNLMTGSAVVANKASALCGVTAITDGVNAATVIIYDNASSAAGKILAKYVIPGASLSVTRNFGRPVLAANGLYASLAGGANAIVEYILTED